MRFDDLYRTRGPRSRGHNTRSRVGLSGHRNLCTKVKCASFLACSLLWRQPTNEGLISSKEGSQYPEYLCLLSCAFRTATGAPDLVSWWLSE